MEESYSIGRLAKAAEVPVSTVRYYEHRGLLPPLGRTDGNYRVYGTESLRRLRFIRTAQGIGFTLEDIALLLKLRDGRTAPCGEVKTLIDKRLRHISDQLVELHRVEKVLRSVVTWCERPKANGACRVLDDLDAQVASLGSATLKKHRS